MDKPKAEPKCPDCGALGVEKIASSPGRDRSNGTAAWYYVVFCEDCGHVYGLAPNTVISHEVKMPPRML